MGVYGSVQIVKVHFMRFSPSFCCSISSSPGQNILLRFLFSNIVSMFLPFDVILSGSNLNKHVFQLSDKPTLISYSCSPEAWAEICS